MQRSREQQIIIGASVFCAATVATLWIVLILAGDFLVSTILDGQGVFAHFKNGASRLLPGITDEERAPLLLAEIWKYAARMTTIYVILQAFVLAGSLRHRTLVRDFFSAESHPLNLAVLRIVYFVTLLPRVKIHSVIELSQLPHELRVAPPGLGWLVANLVESEATLMGMYYVFVVVCVSGTIGLGTRISCITAACLAFYLMGVPQFFGKINHYHHVIWVGALLATSRCGDALSIDAIWRALRGRGSTQAIQPSTLYATPQRIVWLFLGILYFFPGFWKYVISGPQWFLSDGLVHRMWLRMYVSEGWEPIVRFDQWPLLCKFAAFSTIVCEIGFILLIFSKWTRAVVALCAFSFHVVVQLTLNISFWPIHAYFVTFIDWKKLLNRICLRIYRHPLVVEFNPAHPQAPRLVAAAQTLDVSGQVDFQRSPDAMSDEAFGLRVAGHRGGRGLWRLVTYSPLCVLLLPALTLGTPPRQPANKPKKPGSLLGTYVVAAVVLIGSILCGFTMTDSWPIGIYPTFARIIEPTFESMTMEVVDAEGRVISTVELFYDPTIRQIYPPRRLGSVLEDATRRTSGRGDRLQTLWHIWKKSHPEAAAAERVNFYRVEYPTDPQRLDRVPMNPVLLESIPVQHVEAVE